MTITRSTADAIEEAVNAVSDRAIKTFQNNLEVQGHNLSGTLKDSFEVVKTGTQDGIKADIMVEKYGEYIDKGVPANKIPYSGRSGKGGTSKYIEGLREFFIKRGKTKEEALGYAFATAAKQKEEGMPTRASFKFSSNSRRKGFISDEVPAIETDLAKTVEETVAFRLQTDIIVKFR